MKSRSYGGKIKSILCSGLSDVCRCQGNVNVAFWHVFVAILYDSFTALEDVYAHLRINLKCVAVVCACDYVNMLTKMRATQCVQCASLRQLCFHHRLVCQRLHNTNGRATQKMLAHSFINARVACVTCVLSMRTVCQSRKKQFQQAQTCVMRFIERFY